jgi:glutamate synthase domain-containing protein 3
MLGKDRRGSVLIDAKGLDYRELNKQVRNAVAAGMGTILISNVLGQRFIGDGIDKSVEIKLTGTAGGDLGAFMDGPLIYLNGNAEHAAGNTMSGGRIIIHGDAGDCLGHSMRGGKIFVRGSVGYRVGIHMKQFEENYPTIVIGGKAQSFLGEYMAGGVILVLGIGKEECVGSYIGTGIHGGVIYIAGDVEDSDLGVAAKKEAADDSDMGIIRGLVKDYNTYFNKKIDIDGVHFTKIVPTSSRPFSNLYTHE